jgi:hypothetical protein
MATVLKVIVRSMPAVRARRAIVRKATVHMHRAVRNRMATARKVIVRSMHVAHAPKATVRLPRAVRARMATVPVRNRRSRSASRKTVFPRTIDA